MQRTYSFLIKVYIFVCARNGEDKYRNAIFFCTRQIPANSYFFILYYSYYLYPQQSKSIIIFFCTIPYYSHFTYSTKNIRYLKKACRIFTLGHMYSHSHHTLTCVVKIVICNKYFTTVFYYLPFFLRLYIQKKWILKHRGTPIIKSTSHNLHNRYIVLYEY